MESGVLRRGSDGGEQLLTRYRAIRETQKALHAKLLKFIPKGALKKSAKRLGIPFEEKTLIFGAQGEMDVLIDYCIYDFREPSYKAKRSNAVERMLKASPPPDGSDEMMLLQAATRARYCIMLVEKIVRGLGVEVKDVLRKESFFLNDVGFSETAVIGYPLAARVISPDGFNITTGAALPLRDKATALDVIAGLEAEIGGKLLQGVDGLSPQEKARMSAVIIRECLAHDASSGIAYR
jgi:hypothetical protein